VPRFCPAPSDAQPANPPTARRETGAAPPPLAGRDLLVAAVFLALSGFAAWRYRLFQCDDAFIGYRYTRNLLAGRGWVYNPGEAVNGATSPLHILLQAPLGALLGDIPAAAHLLGGLCLALAAWFCYLVLRNLGRREGGLAAGLLLITSPFLLSTFGMETMLYLALAAAALYWYHRQRMLLCAAALALLVLTRADGALLALVLLGHYLAVNRRFPLAPTLLAAAIAAPWFIFSTLNFGSPLPNTLGARLAQGAAGYNIEFFQGAFFWTAFSLRQSLWYLALLPAAALGLAALLARARGHLPLPIWALIYFIAYSLLGVPYQHWYYGPLVLALMLISPVWLIWLDSGRLAPWLATAWLAAAWAALLIAAALAGNILLFTGHDTYLRFRSEHSWQTIRGLLDISSVGVWLPLLLALAAAAVAVLARRRTATARWALAAALFLPVIVAQAHLSYQRSLALPEPQLIAYRDIGTWLQRHTAPDATVAAWEIGAIGYYSDRPLLDYLGLITPEARPAVARNDYKWWLHARPPEYVVVRHPPGGFERAALDDPLFPQLYRPVAAFEWPQWPPMTIYERVDVQ